MTIGCGFDNFFSSKLTTWYEVHKRALPWRETKDPYKIWLSEIILQQTRVVQGIDYFIRMINRFPDVQALANAEEDEVLKYWQGLGYYSRARNLHASAKTIVAEHGGEMPLDHSKLLKLKGIGEYTAAAIVSFAANKPYPVVDGNVFRFLSRYFAIAEPIDTGKGKKVFTELAGNLMDKKAPGLFNQAIMEFGALQCVPRQPDCISCPFADSCMAWEKNKVESYPVKQGKVKMQNRYLHYFQIIHDSFTYIYKRDGQDIWRSLYEFPMIETDKAMDFEELKETVPFKAMFTNAGDAQFKLLVAHKKHVLSHRVLYANFYCVHIENPHNLPKQFLQIKKEDVHKYAVHRLMAEFLEFA